MSTGSATDSSYNVQLPKFDCTLIILAIFRIQVFLARQQQVFLRFPGLGMM